MKKLVIVMFVMLALLSQSCGLISEESDMPMKDLVEFDEMSTKPDPGLGPSRD